MFVTGCHRSGTSLTASVLARLLARIHPDATIQTLMERSDLGPTLANPAGFFESPHVRLLNDEFLALAGCRWDLPPVVGVDWSSLIPHQRFSQLREEFRSMALDPRWVDKDPRLALTYRAWTHVFLRRIPLVVVIRDPQEVAASLYSREASGWMLDRGLLLWYLYNHHLALVAQPGDCLLSYNNLLVGSQDSELRLARGLSEWLKAQGHSSVSPAMCQEVLTATVNSALQRSRGALNVVPSYSKASDALLARCLESYTRVVTAREPMTTFVTTFQDLPHQVLEACTTYCSSLGIGPLPQARIQGLQDALDLSAEQLQRLESGFAQQLADRDHQVAVHAERAAQQSRVIAELEGHLRAFRQSLSWRCTAPLRWLGNHFAARR